MLDIKPMFLCNGVKIVEGYRNAAIYDFNKKKVYNGSVVKTKI